MHIRLIWYSADVFFIYLTIVGIYRGCPIIRNCQLKFAIEVSASVKRVGRILKGDLALSAFEGFVDF